MRNSLGNHALPSHHGDAHFGEASQVNEDVAMTLIVRAAIVSLAFGGLVLTAPQAADAGTCKKLSASAIGFNKANVASRSKRQLKRVINRWAWRKRASRRPA